MDKTKGFKVLDPKFERRVQESFAKQKFMDTIGAELTKILPGEVEICLQFREDLTQQHGFIHAGVVSTLADTACGYAAFSLMPADAAVLTVEFKINLMSPAIGQLLKACGRVKKQGKTLIVCTGDVFALKDGEEKLVATMQATMMCLLGRDGFTG